MTTTVSEIAEQFFDFVVVGGGTAGLTVANRLSENSAVRVAVLEAGEHHFDDPLVSNPNTWMLQLATPGYSWPFQSEPQPRIGNQSLPLSRGKGLGGSSAMNLLLWTRPQLEDIDMMEQLGNEGWNWTNIEPYITKVEKFHETVQVGCEDYKSLCERASVGVDGSVPISFSRTSSGAEHSFQKSLEKYGIPIVSYPLDGQTVGSWKSLSTFDAAVGVRSYATPSYLLPALGRPNLKVLVGAYVKKILTSVHGGGAVIASGVEFQHDGHTYQVHAAREVILSAGAIKTPQILELSGIGNRNILEPLGIAVKKHLPVVGENVSDKVYTPIRLEMRDGFDIVTVNLLQDPEFVATLQKTYAELGADFTLLSTGVTFLPVQAFAQDVDAIVHTAQRSADDADSPARKETRVGQTALLANARVPDVELMVMPFLPPIPGSGSAGKVKPLLSLVVALLHPFSRGTIHVRSADPLEQPAIDPQYFDQAVDLDVLAAGMKFAIQVARTSPFSDLIEREIYPGLNVKTDAELRDAARLGVSTIWHTFGSASMLPADKGGVVNPRLQVYGTKNIRVVDLSVWPVPISAHPQSLVYTLAERASDLIREDHGL